MFSPQTISNTASNVTEETLIISRRQHSHIRAQRLIVVSAKRRITEGARSSPNAGAAPQDDGTQAGGRRAVERECRPLGRES
jgi:hypothetical protein